MAEMLKTDAVQNLWRDRYAARSESHSNDWLADVREAAFARFEAMGFPTTRDEEWKYTNLAPLEGVRFARPVPNVEIPADVLEPFFFDGDAGSRAVFVNGVFRPQLSSLDQLPVGMHVMSLAGAMESHRNLIEPHLTKHADYRESAICALNTALFEDGALVHIDRGVVTDKPLHIVFLSTGGDVPSAIFPRNLVIAEENSKSRIVVTYAGVWSGMYMTDGVTEIVAKENAVVDHYQIERETTDAYHLSTRQVYLMRAGNVSSHSLAFGGRLVRNDINALLDGEGANCMFNGLSVLRESQHVDNHLRVDHAKPHCNSWEFFKGIYDEKSRGVFTGRIIVREDAQKTDAKQSNMNLLLSRDAMIDTKPQLEILADDVKCTHGATVGQLDEDAIFYLRSRGVSEDAARSLLIYAFAGESVGQVRIASLRDKLQELLSSRLAHGESLTFGRPFEYSDDFADAVRSADRRRET
ncbi:MAG: Fe-S cluster assembly protein SufD [Phycisphaerales bacterium]|nr:Fe-S cluster assembly protein SufD [Phycisphaerales bacterium]MCB9864597.1 Fe-S cluster assembly protein SufD [Phycisphaerales bacterium]